MPDKAAPSTSMNIVRHTIARAIRGTMPRSDARMKALASVRWVLATDDGRYVYVDHRAQASLVRQVLHATIYDGRDNEDLKARFFGVLFGRPFSPILLE